MKHQPKPYDIFISYRRDGGDHTAKIIRDALTERGYKTFFDVESLRSGNFNEELYTVIEQCRDFLIILSPGALDRCENEDDWVRREIEHALKHGKNVVPILVRGFVFPDVLPPSVEPLRRRNGLESSTQFFDAFISTLCEKFLTAKAKKHTPLGKRIMSLALAAAVIAGGFLGVRALSQPKQYPRTEAEKNAVNELLYCTEMNLASVDAIALSYKNALQASESYLSSRDGTQLKVYSDLETARSTIEKIDISGGMPSEHLLSALSSSPVNVADVTAMYHSTEEFKRQTLVDLDMLRHTVLDRTADVRTVTERVQLIKRMEELLDTNLRANALCANGLLLPIREEELHALWRDMLPRLSSIPLSESGWLRDHDQIESELLRCTESMEQTVYWIALQGGEVSMRRKGEVEDIIAGNTAAASMSELFLAEAEDLRIRISASKEAGQDTEALQQREQWWIVQASEAGGEINVSQFMPKGNDSLDVLIAKAQSLIGLHMTKSALEIMDHLAATAKDGESFAVAVRGWKTWIEHLPVYGMRYGVLVSDWDGSNPEKNPVLQLGDVITAVDGQECHCFEEYIALKNAAGESFSVSLLRPGEDGEMQAMTLTLTKAMPLVYLLDVCNSLQHLYEEEWRGFIGGQAA